jgi:putative tryptophan/tyrosine transport system substrate-binding protein
MRRRAFITLLGGTAVAWPVAARAQQALPVIGLLGTTSANEWSQLVAAFQGGLRDLGYVDGENVAVEYRWAEGQFDRLPALTADLIGHHAAVIVTTGSANSAQAAKGATANVPIVFVIGTDPVRLGLVASFNRPGGNITGVSWLAAALGAKQLELLGEMLPNVRVIAMLANPNNPVSESELKDVQEASVALDRQILGLHASSEAEIDSAFATIAQEQARALIVSSDSVFFARRDQVVALAARHAVPAIYPVYEYAVAGGLMSYGSRLSDAYRQVGNYTGRILKGEKPADLPVQQATKVELTINLKTAKALGIEIPTALLVRADEIIE